MRKQTANIFVHDPDKNFTVDMQAEFIIHDDDQVNHHEAELVSYTITNMKELRDEDLSFMDIEYVSNNYQLDNGE
jgi:uncharacterized protein (UPF0212 family)